MFLTSNVVDDLVAKLNAQTDIPFLSEESERRAIEWLVNKVVPHLPDWVLDAMNSAADGLTELELNVIRSRTIAETNKVLDIPGIPDFIEGRVIAFVVDAILDYAREGVKAP